MQQSGNKKGYTATNTHSTALHLSFTSGGSSNWSRYKNKPLKMWGYEVLLSVKSKSLWFCSLPKEKKPKKQIGARPALPSTTLYSLLVQKETKWLSSSLPAGGQRRERNESISLALCMSKDTRTHLCHWSEATAMLGQSLGQPHVRHQGAASPGAPFLQGGTLERQGMALTEQPQAMNGLGW